MIALAFALAFAGADPVGLVAGEAAPFAGVLLDEDRIGELIVAEAKANALEKQLVEELAVRERWKAMALEKPADGFLEDPEVNRWIGFAGGVVVAVVAIIAGAWISDLAAAPPAS